MLLALERLQAEGSVTGFTLDQASLEDAFLNMESGEHAQSDTSPALEMID